MASPQTQPPFDVESYLSGDIRQFLAEMEASSTFVSHIMKVVNETVADFMRSEMEEGASTAEMSRIFLLYAKEASQAIRRIYSAWSKYPQAGGDLEGAPIDRIDYRYTATNAIEGNNESLSFKLAIFLANTIDSQGIEFQTIIHEQKRINDCLTAIKKTYKVWQTLLDPPRHLDDDALQVELTSESASPITYTMQPAQGDAPTLTKPSTPAELMSSAAMAEQAEYEMHDNVHIFVSDGKVLRNKAEKIADSAQQLDIIRKAEAKEAKEAKKAKKAKETADALAASRAKGRNKKKIVVVSSSDHEEEEEEEEEDEDEQPAPVPSRKTTKTTTRKRPVEDIEEGGNEDSTPKKTPVPRKRAKKAEPTEAPNDGSSEKASSELNDGSSITPTPQPPTTRAPENAKKGGAAPKWLRDEDNVGKQLVMDHPQWQMPLIYREFNKRLANTAFQTDKMETHAYRPDWVEFPRIDAQGNVINDKEARKFDICWRTYESLRQHLEKHKAKVNNETVAKPFTWTQLTENPVSHLPKRTPPPRPTYFKDGTTLVPQLENESSAAEDASADDTPTSVYQDKEYKTVSGWTPVNKPVGRTFTSLSSSPPPKTRKPRAVRAKAQKDLPEINASEYSQPTVLTQPRTPAEPRLLGWPFHEEIVPQEKDNAGPNSLPGVGQPAPGDQLYGGLEDFVKDQSDGVDVGIEPAQTQLDGPADGNQHAQAQEGALSRRTPIPSAPALSRLPPLSLSQNQGLASGWTQRINTRRGFNQGRVYYLDPPTQNTSWTNPTTPGFDAHVAFAGPNATAPRYPQNHVWSDGQHVPLSATRLSTSSRDASLNDLAIANLPTPEHRLSRAPSAPAARAAGTRLSAVTRGATAPPSARPSLIVKLPVGRPLSAAEKPKNDEESED